MTRSAPRRSCTLSLARCRITCTPLVVASRTDSARVAPQQLLPWTDPRPHQHQRRDRPRRARADTRCNVRRHSCTASSARLLDIRRSACYHSHKAPRRR
eukprot:2533048-Pyramimonas_sp.AAC.1